MLERVLEVIHKIIDTDSNDIAIVTHGVVIMCLQCYVTDMPFNEMSKFKTENTDIIEIEAERLLCCNES